MKISADLVLELGARILGLTAATQSDQPVTLAQMNAAVEGLAWKDAVRVRTTANVNLASPGASLDGVAMAANDRFFAASQTAPADIGIYIWNGAATPATRAPDASTWDELVAAVIPVAEGTSAGTQWRNTNAPGGTLGTTGVTFTSFGTSAAPASETTAGIAEVATQAEVDAGTDNTRMVSPQGLAGHSNRKRKHVAQIGDGAATAYTLTHNFNTRDVIVEVYRNSGNYDTVLPDITRPSVNGVTITFATAPAANAYNVVIIG